MACVGAVTSTMWVRLNRRQPWHIGTVRPTHLVPVPPSHVPRLEHGSNDVLCVVVATSSLHVAKELDNLLRVGCKLQALELFVVGCAAHHITIYQNSIPHIPNRPRVPPLNLRDQLVAKSVLDAAKNRTMH